MKIILASSSPRRKELLQKLGLDFEVIVSGFEEKLEKELTIDQQAQKLAEGKAKKVWKQTTEDRIIIGSDTIVVKEKEILGKPKSKEEAIQMLEKIQGTSHEVITSLCVLIEKQGMEKKYETISKTKVYVQSMTRKEILAWMEKGKYKDRAGAYGIQDEFSIYIQKIEGNYDSVVGLPTHHLYEILKEENLI